MEFGGDRSIAVQLEQSAAPFCLLTRGRGDDLPPYLFLSALRMSPFGPNAKSSSQPAVAAIQQTDILVLPLPD
jgi:hypothetical protein